MNWERSEHGFTLIEILIVIGILSILSTIIALTVLSFIGSGEEEANVVERHIVQEALIAAMSEGDGTYTASAIVSPGSTDWTRDMTVNLGTQCHTNMADYLDESTSRYFYTWTVNGHIVQCTADSPSDCGNAW